MKNSDIIVDKTDPIESVAGFNGPAVNAELADSDNKVEVNYEPHIEDQAPITGEVRWYKPWGKSVGIPGIGVKINSIKESQLQEISEKCKIK